MSAVARVPSGVTWAWAARAVAAPQATPAAALSEGRAHGVMLLYIFLISTSFPLGRLVALEADPFVVTFLRFGLGAIVFGAVLAAHGGWGRPSPSALLRYGVIATLMATFFVAMFESLRTVDPLSAGAIFTLLPLISSAYALVILRQRLSGPLAVLIFFGAFGALWVLFRGSFERLWLLDFGYGEAVFLFGCCAFAAHPVAVKRLHGGDSIARLTFWALVVGTVLLGLVSAPRILDTQWRAISTEVYLAIVFLAVCNTAFTFYLAKSASVVLSPAKVMAYTFLIPGLVAVLEGVSRQAWPEPTVYVGIAITTLAMMAMLKVE